MYQKWVSMVVWVQDRINFMDLEEKACKVKIFCQLNSEDEESQDCIDILEVPLELIAD